LRQLVVCYVGVAQDQITQACTKQHIKLHQML
jgi:hypothetical protein